MDIALCISFMGIIIAFIMINLCVWGDLEKDLKFIIKEILKEKFEDKKDEQKKGP